MKIYLEESVITKPHGLQVTGRIILIKWFQDYMETIYFAHSQYIIKYEIILGE